MANNVDYVISFLGDVSNKAKVKYRWEDNVAGKTEFFQVALREWFPDATIIMLATEESRREGERRIDEAVEAVREKAKAAGKVEWVTIPDGRNEDEFFEIYREVSNNLRSGSRVVLDITHGYRSLPMLVLLALGYLRIANEISLEHVLYGAEASARDNQAPVFDLAPFMNMLDWANATDRFLDTGDARKLAVAMREHTVPLLGEGASTLNQLADTVAQVSNALLMNNPFEAGPLAKKALELLNSLDIGDEHPISLLLDRLKDQMKPMAFDADTDTDKEIVQALFFIISWYITHNHHERAAALAREWIFLFAKYTSRKDIRDTSFKLERDAPHLKHLVDKLDIRHDIAHMNMGVIRQDKDGTKSADARKKLNAIFKELVELASKEGLTTPPPLPRANL